MLFLLSITACLLVALLKYMANIISNLIDILAFTSLLKKKDAILFFSVCPQKAPPSTQWLSDMLFYSLQSFLFHFLGLSLILL